MKGNLNITALNHVETYLIQVRILWRKLLQWEEIHGYLVHECTGKTLNKWKILVWISDKFIEH